MRTTILILASLCLFVVVVYFLKSGELPDPAPSVAASIEQPKASDTSISLDSTRAEYSDKTDHGQEVLKPERTVTTGPAPELEPEIREALGKTLNTSSEGLVEEKAANGAIGMDLQGRFRTAPVATIDAEGNIQVRDYTSLPPPAKKP